MTASVTPIRPRAPRGEGGPMTASVTPIRPHAPRTCDTCIHGRYIPPEDDRLSVDEHPAGALACTLDGPRRPTRYTRFPWPLVAAEDGCNHHVGER